MNKFMLVALLSIVGMVVCMYQLTEPVNPMQVNSAMCMFTLFGAVAFVCVKSMDNE